VRGEVQTSIVPGSPTTTCDFPSQPARANGPVAFLDVPPVPRPASCSRLPPRPALPLAVSRPRTTSNNLPEREHALLECLRPPGIYSLDATGILPVLESRTRARASGAHPARARQDTIPQF
jgi:hypothetical protein